MLNDITARDLALYPHMSKKKRLLGQDRYSICASTANNPGIKQEEIAAHFQVERSTVSKILKDKERWLSIPRNERRTVYRLRYARQLCGLHLSVDTFLRGPEIPSSRSSKR